MTSDEWSFIAGLRQLSQVGSLGVGMKNPLPQPVQSLIRGGYCEAVEMSNPNEVPNMPEVLVRLTAPARTMLDAQFADQTESNRSQSVGRN